MPPIQRYDSSTTFHHVLAVAAFPHMMLLSNLGHRIILAESRVCFTRPSLSATRSGNGGLPRGLPSELVQLCAQTGQFECVKHTSKWIWRVLLPVCPRNEHRKLHLHRDPKRNHSSCQYRNYGHNNGLLCVEQEFTATKRLWLPVLLVRCNFTSS